MFAVAEMTFRKIKEPSCVIMLFFAIALGFLVSDISTLTDQMGGSVFEQMITRKVGHPLLASTLFAFTITALMAIFTGATDIPRDIETGVIMLVLSKPISKGAYLFGKFIGVFCVCALFFTTAEVTVFVAHLIKTGEMYSPALMVRQFYLLPALCPLVAITVMFSCFFGDLTAMVLAAAYMGFSLSASAVPLLVSVLPKSLGVSIYLYMFYFFFPNCLYFFQTMDLIGPVIVALLVYAASMTAIFLGIGALGLDSRDMV